jgi:hypothetical protein
VDPLTKIKLSIEGWWGCLGALLQIIWVGIKLNWEIALVCLATLLVFITVIQTLISNLS